MATPLGLDHEEAARMIPWRVARSLDKLLAQINAAYPGRSRRSDGSIGDAAHASRSSDHNPWVKFPGEFLSIVTARDFTHDPAHGFDAHEFAERLRQSRDPRIKYVISNGRIFSATTAPWQWRRYYGSNQHRSHVHVSVVPTPRADDMSPWDGVTERRQPASHIPDLDEEYEMKRGDKGDAVAVFQRALKGWNAKALPRYGADSDFGGETEEWVKLYQQAADIPVTGRIDGVTAALLVRYL